MRSTITRLLASFQRPSRQRTPRRPPPIDSKSEYATLAWEVIGRLAPLIEPERAREVRHSAGSAAGLGVHSGGAIYSLVGYLAAEGTPVTGADRDDFRRLIDYLRPVMSEPGWQTMNKAYDRLKVSGT